LGNSPVHRPELVHGCTKAFFRLTRASGSLVEAVLLLSEESVYLLGVVSAPRGIKQRCAVYWPFECIVMVHGGSVSLSPKGVVELFGNSSVIRSEESGFARNASEKDRKKEGWWRDFSEFTGFFHAASLATRNHNDLPVVGGREYSLYRYDTEHEVQVPCNKGSEIFDVDDLEDALVDKTEIERAIHEALLHGGEFAEVFVEDRRTTGISLDDRRVEELATGRDRGAGIRVVVGDTTGFAHTADTTGAGLVVAAAAAASIAKRGGGGVREIDLVRQRHPFRSAVEIYPETITKTTKVALLERADDTARSVGGAIRQVSAGYGDSRRRFVVANSDGVYADDDQVRTRLFVMCVAAGDSGMQTGYESIAYTVGYELFERISAEEIATKAANRAIGKLSARPAPSGVLPVVLKSGTGGILFHEACGHGLEADHIVKDASVYANRIGDVVASPLVTLIDDGTVMDEWGTSTIDDEGKPTQRNVLIENGVLTDYMWDLLRSRKAGRTSSGNGRRQSYQHLPMVRMTNTYLMRGSEDPEEIVAQTANGVYVAQLGGGQVNTATGDFVFGMTEAYLIEDGKITEPIRDANLIGNGPDVLQKIDVVGNDFDISPGSCGKDGQSVSVGCGQPTLRISGVTVGGTSGA